MGAMAIGLAPIFAKLAVSDGQVGPIAAGFWRMSVGTLGFALIWRISASREPRRDALKSLLKNSLLPTLTAGLMFALDLAAWHTSFGHTSLASSTLIANLSAVLVPITGVLFFKEVFKPKLLIGGLMAIFGVAGLALFRPTAGRDTSQDSLLLGEGLALLTAFFYTCYMLLIKKLAAHYQARVLMMMSSAVSAIFLLLFSFSAAQNILPSKPTGWLWILGLGLVSQVLGQGLVAKALAVLPVGQSALILLSAPASTAVFSWIFLGEQLQTSSLIAVLMTLVGIGIVAKR